MPKSLLKDAAIQISSGGSAGFVEVCIMHPLDLVKTRFQIQAKRVPGDPQYYNSVLDCMRKMVRSEGLFSLWKGILPPILVETPKRAVKFFTFEQSKRFFLFDSPKPTPLTFSLAGLSAGVTEAVLVNPFERVKVQMQAARHQMKEMPSTWVFTREIIRKDGFGLSGLNKGVTATIARNGIFNMVYFGFYHSVRPLAPEPKEPALLLARNFVLGLISGVMGSALNIPFDVAKSRIQGPQPVPGQIKYRSTIGSIITVYKEEGFLNKKKFEFMKYIIHECGKILVISYSQLDEHKYEAKSVIKLQMDIEMKQILQATSIYSGLLSIIFQVSTFPTMKLFDPLNRDDNETVQREVTA